MLGINISKYLPYFKRETQALLSAGRIGERGLSFLGTDPFSYTERFLWTEERKRRVNYTDPV